MNLPNKLTIIRICIIPFYILFLEIGGFYNIVFAFFLFCIASITDFLDGKIARKNKIVTVFGIFFDPIADKLLISAAFIYFISIPYLKIKFWMVFLMISREFLITGLRSISNYKNFTLSVNKFGKIKTAIQIISIVIIMIIIILKEFFLIFYKNEFTLISKNILKIPFFVASISVLFSVLSGIIYILKYKKMLNEKK
jgi:CDP-diacylglycerol--glycerol-3-phosphate 3-phosphatidyltransferase